METRRAAGIVNVAALVVISAFYVYGSYHQGLFFSPVQYWAMTGAIVAVLALLGVRRTAGDRRVPRTVWFTCMVAYAVYILLTTLWAAAATLAVAGAIVVCACVWFVALGAVMPAFGRRYVLSFISGLGGILYIFGVGTGLQWWSYNAAIEGNMLNSVFQYHNTLGSFELATFLIGLGMMELAERAWARAGYVAASVLSFLGVVSSYSRWVWLLTPVMLIVFVGLQALRGRAQRAAAQALYAVAAGMAATPFAISAMTRASVKGFALALAIAVVGAIACALLDVVLVRVMAARSVRYAVSGGIGVVIAAAVGFLVRHEAHKLNSLVNRAGSIDFKDFSLQQRLLFYQAGLRMWRDHPVFGSGWGTWTAKFQAYEQYPYWSAKVHSVFMNNLIDGGIVGLLLWLGGIVLAVIYAIRCIRSGGPTAEERRRTGVQLTALVGALSLLLHALFDFDFSFPMVAVTFFLLLGMAASRPPEPEGEAAGAVADRHAAHRAGSEAASSH
ncbi:MAG: O-antigen ligase family protein, partial [Alicyclobacillus sp.]|nr:O-antigen ligase family protein [Alicyclobacillus sp.]